MSDGRIRQGPVVGLAALILGVLIAQIALAAGAADSDDIASLKRDNANLHRQLNGLRTQFASAKTAKKGKRGPPGPQGPAGATGAPGATGAQGPQGPAGTAPACQGNGVGSDGKTDQMVSAGAVCIDKYEVSVWSSPTGGTQYGATADDYPCNDNGQNCNNIYARSVPGVTPSRSITWFQAQQALANSGKRLPSNAEWQQAVAGTPDPGTDNGTTDCNVSTGSFVNTGSRSSCISNWGANDMVGNLN